MVNEKIQNALNPEKLQEWLKEAFAKAGIATKDALKDDKKVRFAAKRVLKTMPFVVRSAIKVTIGKNGFEKLVFNVRDKMLEGDSMDLSWINKESIKRLIPGR